MSELGRGARELLERARSADRLGASARERMSQQLLARLGSELAPLPNIDASTVMLSKQTLWLKIVAVMSTKVGWAGAVLLGTAGVMGGLWLGAQPAQRTAAGVVSLQPSAAQTGVEVAQASPPIAAVEVERSGPDLTAPHVPAVRSVEVEGLREPRATRARAAARARSPRSGAGATQAEALDARVPPSAASGSINATPQSKQVAGPEVTLPATAVTLDAELELLQQAQTELSAGRPARALPLLEQHAATFRHGKLEQAREVALMLAMCQLGRAHDARARAEQFLLAHPHSPFVGRVRQICH